MVALSQPFDRLAFPRPLAAALVALALAALPAHAADFYYVGPDNGSWSDPANWSASPGGTGGAGVPMTGDNALVRCLGTSCGPIDGLPRTVNYDYSGPAATYTYLYVGSPPGDHVTLGSGTLRATTEYVGRNTVGSIDQTNGSNLFTDLQIGVETGSQGSYSLSGGTLSGSTLYVGDNGDGTFTQTGGTCSPEQLYVGDGTGTGVYNFSGGTLNVSAVENVGRGCQACTGFGTFNHSAGSHVLTYLIVDPGGTYNLFGTGSLTSVDQISQLIVDGVYHQYGSSSASFQGPIRLGRSAGHSGTIVLDSGTLDIGYEEYIGEQGSGTFTQNGGTHTVNGSLFVGYQPGSSGTYDLNGGTLTVHGNIVNNGTVTQAPGATLNLDGVVVGTGIVHSAGPTTITAGSRYNGGTLSVEGGTTTTTGTVAFADSSGTASTLAVSGGTTTVNGTLGIGNDGTLTGGTGTGTITATDGTLNAQTIILGSSAGGAGTMNVSLRAQIVVGGGLTWNDATVSGGALTVLHQAPPAGEDPVLWRSMVGGYLRDGAMHVHGGAVVSPRMKLGVSSGHTGSFDMDGGTVTLDTLGVGNDATLTGGQGTGTATISGGTLNAATVILGSSAGGSGTMTVSGSANIVVGGGFTTNDLIMNGGTVTVKDTIPPASEDPVLNRSIVCGYLHDGALVMSGGTVTTPNLKIGVTAGKIGTLTLSGGTVTAGNVVASNAAGSVMTLNGGTLRSGQSSVNTGSPLTIGNGTNAARLDLYPAGGTHTFAQGLSIAANAQLTGAGTIGGNVANGGTVSPGSAAGDLGTLAVNGSYTQSANGTLAVEIEAQPANDALTVSGTATLSGTLNVTRAGSTTPAIGHPFTVLVGHPVTGAFATVTGAGVAVSYTDTSVVVTFTGVDVPGPGPGAGPATPLALALEPVQPNPLDGAGAIAFDLPRDAAVRVAIVDAGGRLVRTVAAGEFAAGRHTVAWDGRSESGEAIRPGVYWARLTAMGRSLDRRFVVF